MKTETEPKPTQQANWDEHCRNLTFRAACQKITVASFSVAIAASIIGFFGIHWIAGCLAIAFWSLGLALTAHALAKDNEMAERSREIKRESARIKQHFKGL